MLPLVEQWLANYHEKTYQSYHNTIEKFCAAVPLSIEQIQTSHVRNWLNSLAPAHIHRIVKRAALRASLPQAEKVSPHWLRHAHATHALENHAPIALVQATLGHVSLETTSKSLHIRPSQSSGDFL